MNDVVEIVRARIVVMLSCTVSMLVGRELCLLFHIRLNSSIATALHEFKHGSFLLPYKK